MRFQFVRFSFLRFSQIFRAERSSSVIGLSERSRSVTLVWSKLDSCDPDNPLFKKTFLSGSFKVGGSIVKSSLKTILEEGLVRLSNDKDRREGME